MHKLLRLLCFLLTLSATPAAAAPYVNDWDFNSASGLTFDAAKIEVSDGAARLRANILSTDTALSLNVSSLYQSASISTFLQSGLDLGNDSFLFATWVKLRNVSVTHAIFNKRGVINGRTVGVLMQLVPHPAGYQVRVLIGTADRELEFNSQPSIRDTEWHQLALAVDRSQGRAQVYIDGQPFGGTWSISSLVGGLDSIGSFTLGIDSASSQLRGDLDETHFWRFSPGATPNFDSLVASHFDDTVVDITHLVSAWRFDDGTGNDSVGSNHLTLAGSPGFPAANIIRYATDAPYLQTGCENGGGTTLYAVDHALTALPERAEIRYQISGDGTAWWYLDPGDGWVAATTASASQASLLYSLREHLPDAPIATGSVCLRAFFLSDGLYRTGIDQISFSAPPVLLALVAQPAAGRPAPGSFHVIFETDYAADAFVEYRNLAAGPAWQATPVSAGGTVFGIDVAGLDPGATYEYRARFRPRGTINGFAASPTRLLPVAPVANTAADIEFAVWGDSRPSGADPVQPQAFYRLMEQIAGDGPVFHVAVGDNVNLSGSQPFGTETAIDMYRGWRDAYDIAAGTGYMFFALGNHDEGFFDPLRSLAPTARLRSTVQPTDGDPDQRYYSWRWGDALFLAMDGSFSTPKPAQLTWLYQTLQQNARWKFVFNHYPLFNSARGISDPLIRNDMHANFLARGVSIVFQAHDHWYADTVVNDIHYTTSGGGGSTLADAGTAATFNAITEYHYLRVRLQPYAATVRAIQVNEDGSSGPELDRYCVRANDSPWDNTDGEEETDVCDEDDDADGVADTGDNCRIDANADQRDSNGDGFGNFCDADFDNNGIVNAGDLVLFRQAFGTSASHFDLDGNGSVNVVDLVRFRALFGAAPGPGAN